jgi:RHS repeat-associated protein
VLVTISDKKIAVSANGTSIDYYTADVVTASDYYPFGSQMPGRKFAQANSSYRYGFNGKENDKDAGEGIQDYGMRIYDMRLARFLSVDPLASSYPWYTPYQFAGNKPIWCIDLDGKEEWFKTMVDILTSHQAALAYITQSTITQTVTFEAQAGAMSVGGAAKLSVGTAIDYYGNIGIFGTGVTFWDLFGLAGGISSRTANDLPEGSQFVAGGGLSVEFGMGMNFSNHIQAIAGSSKAIEVGAEAVVLPVGGEIGIGTDVNAENVQSIDLALTLGPGTPFEFSALNTKTVLIGVTSENLNQIANTFVEATSYLNTPSLLPTNGNSRSLNARKNVDKNGTINIFIDVLETSADGCQETIFSKKAATFYPNKDNNYIRTKEVKGTEIDED